MSMLNHRLQVLIDEERYERLVALSEETGRSIGELVREAVDRTYPPVSEEKRRAGREILEAEPMPVPDVEELKRELNEARDRFG